MKNVDKPRRAKAKRARAPRARNRERQSERKDAANDGDRQGERGFLFEDPYWDDAFCSYFDPNMRTCCPNRGK
jgi:hypothetical protein